MYFLSRLTRRRVLRPVSFQRRQAAQRAAEQAEKGADLDPQARSRLPEPLRQIADRIEAEAEQRDARATSSSTVAPAAD